MKTGWRNYLSGHLDEEKIKQIFANYRSEDSPMSLPEHFVSLDKAGFNQVDILWKRYNFALYSPTKLAGGDEWTFFATIAVKPLTLEIDESGAVAARLSYRTVRCAANLGRWKFGLIRKPGWTATLKKADE